MKGIFKKNQLMITALAVMIAIAGYLQFAGTNPEGEFLTGEKEKKASTVDSGGVITENYTSGAAENEMTYMDDLNSLLELSDEELLSGQIGDIPSLDADEELIVDDYLDLDLDTVMAQKDELVPSEGEIPGEAVFTNTGSAVQVLSDAKLLKEQTRAKNKQTLLDIINSAQLNEEQKAGAVASMVQMTEISEKEAAAEILLEAKGFSDVVVSVNGNSVDVVVNALELSEAQRAQIEDIVSRKTGVAAENIIISTIVQ